jgi:hypothetical protein
MCKQIIIKKLTKKKLWTFKWPEISHSFVSPYHNHFWVDFNFYFLYKYIKKITMVILHMETLVH